MVSSNLWLALAVSRTSAMISEYDSVYEALNLSPTSYPMFTAMIGKKLKSDMLSLLIDKPIKNRLPRAHGQAYLYTDRSARTDTPTIYVDYELQSWDTLQSNENRGNSLPQRHVLDLFTQDEERWSRRRVGNLICGRNIAPLCDTLCYFAMDLGGIRPVAVALAEHLLRDPSTEVPFSSLPRVLVVVETIARHFDAHATEARILETMESIWQKSSLATDESFTSRLRSHYFDVRVIGILKRSKPHQKSVQLRKRLLAIKREVHISRTIAGLRFRRDHIFAFASQLLGSTIPYCSKPFSLVEASRPAGLHLDDLTLHLKNLIELIPSEIWLCHLVVPLLSSCLILATYPPGSHSKLTFLSII